jgi:hypothetical protein
MNGRRIRPPEPSDLTGLAHGRTLPAMTGEPIPDKAYYSLAEVAEICARPPGLIRRWIHRRQLAVVWLEDVPLVPADALRARLRHPRRIERSLRGRHRRLTPGGEDAG